MMEAANQERWIVQHEPAYQHRNLWMCMWGDIEKLVIEDPSAETWNSAYEKLVMHWGTISDPELMCQTLLKKLEEVGCREKNSAWNIAQFISFCLSRTFEYCRSFSDNGNSNLVMGRSHNVFKVQLIWEIVRPKSEVDFFKFLLKYGFLQPIDIHSQENNLEVIRAICLINAPETEQQIFTFETLRKLQCGAGFLDKLRYSDGKFKGAFQRGFKRLVLTAKCVRALQKRHRQNGDGQYYAQCMRLYFRGVKDPFVQAEEVREFLSFFLADAKKEAVDAMVTVFESLFPESVAPYQPRSLQHLCRCQVREVLSPKSEALPELIKNLKIPLKMKMYILGDF